MALLEQFLCRNLLRVRWNPAPAEESEATYPTTNPIVTPFDSITNFALTPTIYSVQTGYWDDPDTWSENRVPDEDDIVAIYTTHIVTIRDQNAVAARIGVAGHLRHDHTANTRLVCGTIQTYPDTGDGEGYYGCGTPEWPVEADKTAELIFADVALLDPNTGGVTNKEYSNGLINHGKVVMKGATRTRVVRSTGAIDEDDTTLNFSTQSGWRSGDEVLMPDTRHFYESAQLPFQIEKRTISSVTSTSVAVTAMDHDHICAVDFEDTVDYTPPITNLSSNVTIKSENPNGVRGHTIHLDGCYFDSRNVLYEGLGRTKNTTLPNTTTNQKGRYPIHCHHVRGPGNRTEGNGGLGYDASVDPNEFKPGHADNTRSCNGPVLRVIGCVIREAAATSTKDMKWPLTFHDTCDSLAYGNVIYDGTGAGIMLEDGVECFNVFDANFICLIRGNGDRGDGGYSDHAAGREGNAVSCPNPDNLFRFNIACNLPIGGGAGGGLGCGWHFYNGTSSSGTGELDQQEDLVLPAWQGADPTEDPLSHNGIFTMRQFYGNEVFGMGAGVIIWFIGTHYGEEGDTVPFSDIHTFHTWHLKVVFDNFPIKNVRVINLKARGDWNQIEQASGVWDGLDYKTIGLVFDGCDVQGFRTGIGVPSKASITDSTGNGLIWIKNSFFRNRFNFFSATMQAAGAASSFGPRHLVVEDCTLELPGLGGGEKHLWLFFHGQETDGANWVQPDKHDFIDCIVDGVLMEDSRFHWIEEDGDYITPHTQGQSVGSPEEGQTNTANLAEHSVCVANNIWDGTDTVSGFDGHREVLAA